MILHRLYKQDSKGKPRFWQVEIGDETGNNDCYRTISGLIDGKGTVSEFTRVKGKNIGRSNETTSEEQCIAEVNSLYTKKMDKHYVTDLGTIKDERAYFEVMLAEKHADIIKKPKKIAEIFPPGTRIFTQPKLDGLRGPTDRNGTISRGGNEFAMVRFLQEQLQPAWDLYPDLVLDGELYNHEYKDDFDEIVSTIKRGKTDKEADPAELAKARELAQLHVYDCFLPSQPQATFVERQGILNDVFRKLKDAPSIVRVRTDEVSTLEETDALYAVYLEEGYEGQMIRTDAPYAHKRVWTLLKRKEVQSEEFEVVELLEGKGNWSKAVKKGTFRLPDGRTFGAGVRGKKAFLQDLWARVQRGEKPYKVATVLFQNYTPDGIPRFGRVKQFYVNERDD